MNQLFEIYTDGTTVWVNGPGVCLGRFGPRGVDVHRNAEEQMAGEGQCLDCRVEPDWSGFVSSMQIYHQIEVDAKYRPAWCKEGANVHGA